MRRLLSILLALTTQEIFVGVVRQPSLLVVFTSLGAAGEQEHQSAHPEIYARVDVVLRGTNKGETGYRGHQYFA